MQINTKYHIGQVVLFDRPIKQVNGEIREIETHVGIITKIVVYGEGDQVKYHYCTSSGGNQGFNGAVKEDWIKYVMVPTAAPST